MKRKDTTPTESTSINPPVSRFPGSCKSEVGDFGGSRPFDSRTVHDGRLPRQRTRQPSQPPPEGPQSIGVKKDSPSLTFSHVNRLVFRDSRDSESVTRSVGLRISVHDENPHVLPFARGNLWRVRTRVKPWILSVKID